MNQLSSLFEQYHDTVYVVMRILTGLLFLQHGVQKLFGGLGGEQVSSFVSLTGLAGIIEFVGGVFLVVGLFTRLAALISGVEMLVAYFMAHATKAWAPIMNGGETALLYFTLFLIFIVHGGKRFSLDTWLWTQ